MSAARVVVAHTADAGPEALAAARALMDDVFEGDFDDHDWDHALGGVHAFAYDDATGALVGHAAVAKRIMIHNNSARRVGYVEAVGVAASHRRAGIAGRLMSPLEEVIRKAYAFGVLGAADEAIPFYERRGWRAWQGEAYALTPAGVERTPDEEGVIYVLADDDLDLAASLTCDWRDGDVW